MNAKPCIIAEAVDQLQQWLTPDQIADFAAQSEDDLADHHFGLGLCIRNEFGLWDTSSPLLQDCQASDGVHAGDIHPDDASMLILRALWVRLHH
jgi:hypothetical protein